MPRLSWLLCGACAAVIAQFVAGMAFVKSAQGFSTRAKPSFIETWIARTAHSMAIPAKAKLRVNPIANSLQVLAEARFHWADHCASCHANDGSGETEMGKHLYPPAPDMRKDRTQQMSDGEMYYIIENGIRLSGMPAWGGSDHGEKDSWKLVHFIRHLPQLSRSEQKEMEKLNPVSPAEFEEQRQEEQFLEGKGR